MREKPKIDFIVTWVDGSDPEWLRNKARFLGEEIEQEKIDAGVERYREWGHLRYWFRAVEKYAPWVNQVHFVTCGHLPVWLNTKAPKLHIVKHEDYIPAEYLPTFSSRPIELNMHRIESLGEQFVLFNDDFYLTAPVKPEDFFVNGLPCDSLKEDPLAFTKVELYNHTQINDILFAGRHFQRKKCRKEHHGKWFSMRAPKSSFRNLLTSFMGHNHFFGLSIHHFPQAYLKSSLEQLWILEPKLLHETSGHRFRDPSDISQHAIKFWQLLSGKFCPYEKDRFGKVFNVTSQLDDICECIEKKRYKAICINDDPDVNFENAKQRLDRAFESVLSEKSSFEL